MPSKAPNLITNLGKMDTSPFRSEILHKKEIIAGSQKNEENDKQERVYFFGISSGGRFKPFGGES